MEKNLYEILELDKSATLDDIKHAYKLAARVHHPDVTGGTATEVWHEIQEAYFILRDPVKRKQYDITGVIPRNNELLRQEVYNFINDHLRHYMDQSEDIFNIDIIGDIKKSCDTNILNSNNQMNLYNKKLNFLEKFKKKFKKKKYIENDVINVIFIEQITHIKDNITQCYKDIEICNATKDILDNYEFDLTKYLTNN